LLQSGVEKLAQLRVLFLSNNRIKDWSEVDRLAVAEKLEELLLVGNPLYNEAKDANTLPDYRVEVRCQSIVHDLLKAVDQHACFGGWELMPSSHGAGSWVTIHDMQL
jgi:hypothetical protein